MKKLVKILVVLFIILLISVISGVVFYFINLNPVSKESKEITFEVKENDTFSTLGVRLEEQGLIKSDLVYKIYVKLNSPTNLQVGPYSLNQNMSVEEIIKVLSSNNTYNLNAVSITFREGLNLRHIADIISDNTINSYDSVMTLLEDDNYIDSLISKYWFLTDEIKNLDIYYPLEGYLYPNTYTFDSNEVTVEEIFEKMLDQTDVILQPLKSDIDSSSYTIHEMLTMASIVELEAGTADDRAGVAGVFYNRLQNYWSLGSDVTTYYAEKIEMSDRDLYISELNEFNAYNTRSAQMAGMLPVSPICNPSIESIDASINPRVENYFYFVADKNGKTYFNVTDAQHNETINYLKSEGLWFIYE